MAQGNYSIRRLDTRSPQGHGAMKLFLSALGKCVEDLNVEVAPRAFRRRYTKNYRALFWDSFHCFYRVDVLDAALETYTQICVNGETYDFNEDVVNCGLRLKESFNRLLVLTKQLSNINPVRQSTDIQHPVTESSRSYEDSDVADYGTNNSSRDSCETDPITRCETPVGTPSEPFEDKADIDFALEANSVPTGDTIRRELEAVDGGFARFEEAYINQLMRIETRARRFVAECYHANEALKKVEDALADHVDNDRGEESRESISWSLKLTNAAQRLKDGHAQEDQLKGLKYFALHEKLLQKVGTLNSVANQQRKGRDDFRADVLFVAESILRDSEAQSVCTNLAHIEVLATACVTAFRCIRGVLVDIQSAPEKIDPHLAHNPVLVRALVKLEEAWEIGTNFLTQPEPLKFLSDFVTFCKSFLTEQTKSEGSCAQRRMDASDTTCTNTSPLCQWEPLEAKIGRRDVEAMLILPRILVLFFLTDPNGHQEALKRFLPGWFPGGEVQPGTGASPTGFLAATFNIWQKVVNRGLARNSDQSTSVTASKPRRTSTENGVRQFLQSPPGSEAEAKFLSQILNRMRYRNFLEEFLGRRKGRDLKSHSEAYDRLVEAHISLVALGLPGGDDVHDLEGDSNMFAASVLAAADETERKQLCKRKGAYDDVVHELVEVAESFFHAVEETSISIQRRSPQEWNTFCQVLLLCIEEVPAPENTP